METKMIIGIDHGNRNMKTANTVFSAAIQPLQARPDSLEHEMRCRGLTDASVKMGAALPPRRFQQ